MPIFGAASNPDIYHNQGSGMQYKSNRQSSSPYFIATSSLHGQLRTGVKGRGVEWEILAVDYLHTQGIDVSLSTDVLRALLTPYFVTVSL